MIIVVADTSGLLAALDSAHPEHQGANEALLAAGLLVMSPLLLAEIDHVATRELGRNAAVSAIDDIRRWMRVSRIVVPEITESHLSGVAAPAFQSCPGIRQERWPVDEQHRFAIDSDVILES